VQRLKERNSDVHVTAVDVSERNVALTKQRGVEAAVADALTLPYGDDSVGTVVLNEYVGGMNLDEAFHDAFRVLEPGGKIIITIPPAPMDIDERRRVSELTQFIYYQPTEVQKALHNIGFESSQSNAIPSSLVPEFASDQKGNVLQH